MSNTLVWMGYNCIMIFEWGARHHSRRVIFRASNRNAKLYRGYHLFLESGPPSYQVCNSFDFLMARSECIIVSYLSQDQVEIEFSEFSVSA